MARYISHGTCSLCGKRAAKAGMSRHLKTCAPEHEHADGETYRLFHLRVEDFYDATYWLNLEIKADACLADLDDFLRKIWVECCGHLSAFRIGGLSFSCNPTDFWEKEYGMDVPLSKVLNPAQAKFTYEYDFGSTTRLALRVVGERDGNIGRAPLRLLARNEPPVWPCAVCERPATRICTYCMHADNPFFCDEHAAQHDCGEEALLPVVNSPRMGVCGYTG